MNELALMTRLPRRISSDDLWSMVDRGEIAQDDRIELIDGEIVPMAPKGVFHEMVKGEVADWLGLAVRRRFRIGYETSITLDGGTVVEPDLCVYRRGVSVRSVRGTDILLAIEVAHSSITGDIKIKAPLYARSGIADYWIVDALRKQIVSYRAPGDGGYEQVRLHGADDPVTPLLIPDGVPLVLSALDWPLPEWQ